MEAPRIEHPTARHWTSHLPTLPLSTALNMKNKEGWDGKMRVEPKAVITNPEALEDSDYSDPEAPPVEEIDADEGREFLRGTVGVARRGRIDTDGHSQIYWQMKM